MSSILILPYTVAEWGGIHEYVCSVIPGFIAQGYQVSVAASSSTFQDRVSKAGGNVVQIDWLSFDYDKMVKDVKTIDPDLILATPQKSRELALLLGDQLSIPVYIQFHGYYPDGAAVWSDEVAAFAGVTGALTEMLTGYCRVDSWKVFETPNGVPLELFDGPEILFEDKFHDGNAVISLASRLEADKLQQLPVLSSILESCGHESDVRWKLNIYGDGAARDEFEKRLELAITSFANIEIEFCGWKDPAEIDFVFRESLFTVGAGRSAIKSIAVGTPCFAVGKYGYTGLSTGDGIRAGLWNNFGDYPVGSMASKLPSIDNAFHQLMDEGYYHEISTSGRKIMRNMRGQDVSDRALHGFLGI